jgi:hypothetical protein
MRANPGHLPVEAIGKRVNVRLRSERAGDPTHNWPADGRFGCRWSLSGSPVDITEYEVAK